MFVPHSEVTKQWHANVDPTLDTPHCKEATAGYAATGTTPRDGAGASICQTDFDDSHGSLGDMHLYNPIFVIQNLRNDNSKGTTEVCASCICPADHSYGHRRTPLILACGECLDSALESWQPVLAAIRSGITSDYGCREIK